MAPPEVEKALRLSFVKLKEEFGQIIRGMGAMDLVRGNILDISFGLPPSFIRRHAKIINMLRRSPDIPPFGSYYGTPC